MLNTAFPSRGNEIDVLIEAQSLAVQEGIFNRVNDFIQKNQGDPILKSPSGKILLMNHEKMGRVLSVKRIFEDCEISGENGQNFSSQIIDSLGSVHLCALYDDGRYTQFDSINDFSKQIMEISKRALPSDATIVGQLSLKSEVFQELSRNAQRNAIESLVTHLFRFFPRFRSLDSNAKQNEVYKFLCHNNIDSRVDTCAGGLLDIKKEIKAAIVKAEGISLVTDSQAVVKINQNYISLNKKLEIVSRKIDAEEGYFYIPKVWDSSDPIITNEAVVEFREYQRSFSDFSSTPIGSLLYTDSLESSGGRFKRLDEHDMIEEKEQLFDFTQFQMQEHSLIDIEDLKKAKEEVRDKIGKQFRLLNYQEKESIRAEKDYGEFIRKRDPRYNEFKTPGSIAEINHQTMLHKEIDRLVRTNPVAVAQLLVKNPEYTPLICNSIQRAEKTIKDDEEWNKTWGHGGLIVGGILMATGIFAPEGSIILGASAGVGLIVGVADTMYFGGRALSKAREYENYKRGFFGGSSNSKALVGAQETAQDYEVAMVDFGLSLGFSILDFKSLSKAKKLLDGADELQKGKTILSKSKEIWEQLAKEDSTVLARISEVTKVMGRHGKEKVVDYFNLISTLSTKAKENILNQLRRPDFSPDRFRKHIDDFLVSFNKRCSI